MPHRREKAAHPIAPTPLESASSQTDEAAFEALFHAHYGGLCEYIHSFVRCRDVAEELAQDVFVRLWDRHTRAPVALALPYMYTAARNRALSYLRHERIARTAAEQIRRDADSYVHESSSSRVLSNDLADAAERVIATLPERCRLIFLMSRREGLTYSEIASALEISVNTVETQISRALKQLRTRLSGFLAIAVAPAITLVGKLLS